MEENWIAAGFKTLNTHFHLYCKYRFHSYLAENTVSTIKLCSLTMRRKKICVYWGNHGKYIGIECGKMQSFSMLRRAVYTVELGINVMTEIEYCVVMGGCC